MQFSYDQGYFLVFWKLLLVSYCVSFVLQHFVVTAASTTPQDCWDLGSTTTFAQFLLLIQNDGHEKPKLLKNSTNCRIFCHLKHDKIPLLYLNKDSSGPFLKSPDNLLGPVSYFMRTMLTLKIKILLALKAKQ